MPKGTWTPSMKHEYWVCLNVRQKKLTNEYTNRTGRQTGQNTLHPRKCYIDLNSTEKQTPMSNLCFIYIHKAQQRDRFAVGCFRQTNLLPKLNGITYIQFDLR